MQKKLGKFTSRPDYSLKPVILRLRPQPPPVRSVTSLPKPEPNLKLKSKVFLTMDRFVLIHG